MTQNKSDVSTKVAVAGVAGAVLGGVAVAAATILSDDKNRKKVGSALNDVKDRARDYIEDKADEVDVDGKIDDASNKAKDASGKAKDKAKEVADEATKKVNS